MANIRSDVICWMDNRSSSANLKIRWTTQQMSEVMPVMRKRLRKVLNLRLPDVNGETLLRWSPNHLRSILSISLL